MAKKKGASLIVADPRHIELADYADVFLQMRPGTDGALLNGLLNVVVEEDLIDKAFIKERTEGFEELVATVKKYTPEYTEEITGVPAEDIQRAARLYANAESAAICYTMGITQHVEGTNNVLAIANLAMAAGHLGKPNSGVNPLRGQNNVQGACDMGALPNVFTGYQRVDADNHREKFEKAWGAALNPTPGYTVTEVMDAVLDGKVKFLYVMGENPSLSDPNLQHVDEALAEVDFLVVQDIFLTETAQKADVVLPAAAFAEKGGTFVNTERRVQLIRQAVTPPGEARPDWAILTELAQRLGLSWTYESEEEVFREITALTPSYAGISYQRLENEGGLQWPCPEEGHPGTPILHKGTFTKGMGVFTPVEYSPPPEETCQDYPLILTTGRDLYHYHTGSMTRKSKGLAAFRPEERAQVNPEDAKALGIEEGDAVTVTSRRGEVTARSTITDIVPPGVVFMTFHFHESAVNLLTCCEAIDPVAKIPELKTCAIKLEKVAS